MSIAPYAPLTRNYGVGLAAAYGAFGAVTFNGPAVWQDWLSGANGNGAAGARAADTIRAALGQLGYGPFTMGGSWGTDADKAGYSAFVAQQGISAGPNGSWWPTEEGILKLQQLVKAGGNPGGGPAQVFTMVDGQFVPGGHAPLSLVAKLGLLAAAVVCVGGAAYAYKKRRKPSYKPNRRRHYRGRR